MPNRRTIRELMDNGILAEWADGKEIEAYNAHTNKWSTVLHPEFDSLPEHYRIKTATYVPFTAEEVMKLMLDETIVHSADGKIAYLIDSVSKNGLKVRLITGDDAYPSRGVYDFPIAKNIFSLNGKPFGRLC